MTQVADAPGCTFFDPDWHQGVVGLVASRVKEKYHRPTVALARADERWLRGSGRSIDGVHLRDTLDLVTKRAPDLVQKFGGHAMAAGATLALEGQTVVVTATTARSTVSPSAEPFEQSRPWLAG